MANVLDDEFETLDFADESGHMQPETASGSEDTYDFPSYAEYAFTLRYVEKVEVDSREDGTMKLACRAPNGAKVWLNIVGLTPGVIINQVLSQLSKGK